MPSIIIFVHMTQCTMVDSLHSIRKEQLMVVACRVQSEYSIRMAAKDKISKLKEEFTISLDIDPAPVMSKGVRSEG